MGSPFEITVVAPNEELGYINIQEAAAEIVRIERLISSWDPESQTSAINRQAGIAPVKVDRELFKLIERATQIATITNGAFDITYAPLKALWPFKGDARRIPSKGDYCGKARACGLQANCIECFRSNRFSGQKGDAPLVCRYR